MVIHRRQRVSQGTVPTQAELLKLWDINEEAAAPPATTVKLPAVKPAAEDAAAEKTPSDDANRAAREPGP